MGKSKQRARILGLDLGNNTAWGILQDDKPIGHGRWTYQPASHKFPGDRWLEFQRWLAPFLLDQRARADLLYVAYERPFFRGKPAEILHGFETILNLECARHGLNPLTVNPMTLKKWATGTGRASKHYMSEVLQHEMVLRDVPNMIVIDWTEDEVDAMWVALHAQHTIKALLHVF